jgi:hypothetical protein
LRIRLLIAGDEFPSSTIRCRTSHHHLVARDAGKEATADHKEASCLPCLGHPVKRGGARKAEIREKGKMEKSGD